MVVCYIYLYQAVANGGADELGERVDEARGHGLEAEHHGAEGHRGVQVRAADVAECLLKKLTRF